MIGLMAYYPAEVSRRLASPESAGELPDSNATGISASFECGTFVRVFLSIETSTKVIKGSGFTSNGCGFAVAAADVIVGLLRDRSLQELGSLRDESIVAAVSEELGRFPSSRMQCMDVVIGAVREALADHRKKYIEEFQGEKPLVCTCFGVTEERVLDVIATSRPGSVDEITRICNAGGGCGSCRMLLEEILFHGEDR